MLTSLFSLFYVTGEFHWFLHRVRALLAVAVDAQNDSGEETSDPNGDKLPWFTYEINK